MTRLLVWGLVASIRTIEQDLVGGTGKPVIEGGRPLLSPNAPTWAELRGSRVAAAIVEDWLWRGGGAGDGGDLVIPSGDELTGVVARQQLEKLIASSGVDSERVAAAVSTGT